MTLARAVRFGPDMGLSARLFGRAGAPIVALMHGWGGQGSQLFRLAMALADNGFQAVVVDCGNHGESAAMPLGFDRFMLDARSLADHLAEMPFAWVAHSAAALAIMSARRTHGLSARAYVAIAAPFVPYVPLNRFRATGACESAIDQLKPLLAGEFQAEWRELENGLAWQPEPEGKLLAIYDLDDSMVAPGDAERIAAVWPDCRIQMTKGFGHNKVLGAEPVIAGILAFLRNLVAASRTARE